MSHQWGLDCSLASDRVGVSKYHALARPGLRAPRPPTYTLQLAAGLLFSMLACLLGGCQVFSPPPSSSSHVIVTFTQSTHYTSAIDAITNLGLQPDRSCRNNVMVPYGATDRWTRWDPLDEQYNFDHGALKSIGVMPTVLAPGDWQGRLQSLAIVSKITQPGDHSCGNYLADASPTPGVPYFLTQAQAGDYARITVGSQVTSVPRLSYEQAVTALVDLGLRLADPCRERARDQHGTGAPGWTPVGQEKAYSVSHQLVVATTTYASDQWQQQVRAIATGTRVETPYTPAC